MPSGHERANADPLSGAPLGAALERISVGVDAPAAAVRALARARLAERAALWSNWARSTTAGACGDPRRVTGLKAQRPSAPGRRV